MLEDDRRPLRGHLKRNQPALSERFPVAKSVERGEVTIRERYVQLFHPRPVFERTGGDAFLHFDRNVAVKSWEKAEPAALVARAQNDLIELDQNVIDCLWGHGMGVLTESPAEVCQKPDPGPPAGQPGWGGGGQGGRSIITGALAYARASGTEGCTRPLIAG